MKKNDLFEGDDNEVVIFLITIIIILILVYTIDYILDFKDNSQILIL